MVKTLHLQIEHLGISSLLGTLLKTLGSLFNSMGSLSRPKVELGLVLLSVKKILFSFLFLKTELPRNSMIKYVNWDYQLGSIFCRMFIERNSTKSGDISNIPCHLAFSYLFWVVWSGLVILYDISAPKMSDRSLCYRQHNHILEVWILMSHRERKRESKRRDCFRGMIKQIALH